MARFPLAALVLAATLGLSFSAEARRDCHNDGKDVGTVLGAVAGGLVGRTIDTRGDRTAGTLIGAGAGALIGRGVGDDIDDEADYENGCPRDRRNRRDRDDRYERNREDREYRSYRSSRRSYEEVDEETNRVDSYRRFDGRRLPDGSIFISRHACYRQGESYQVDLIEGNVAEALFGYERAQCINYADTLNARDYQALRDGTTTGYGY